MKITSGIKPTARRMLIYGDNGIGKNWLASKFPRPLFINLEDGCDDTDCSRTERLKSYGEVVDCVSWLITNEHDYKTIVIDTADWLERAIFDEVAKAHNKKKINEIGYGKGYELAEGKWQFLIDGLTVLWKAGIHILLTAHVEIEKFANPEGDQYNYYKPLLDDRGSKIVGQWCSEVLFLNTRVRTVEKEAGFNRNHTFAVGSDRVIYTTETASHVAKNRLNMPAELPLAWESIEPYLPKLNGGQQTGNINGVVKDGSSKS